MPIGAEILDACCGSRMFWYDKDYKSCCYMDNRELTETLCDGRTLRVRPDIIGDFRNIPFPDESFNLVIFDPPHLLNVGDNSWTFKKYGKLDKSTWKDDLAKGFLETMRVLKKGGTMVFKWSDVQIPLSEILEILHKAGLSPLVGTRSSQSARKNGAVFLVFYKGEDFSCR